jgi:hypothetical protein
MTEVFEKADKNDGESLRSTNREHSVDNEVKVSYPTGLRLVLLAGASIMGVFLISLDQVSSSYDSNFTSWPRAIPQ